MRIDALIVGQGLAGSLLAWEMLGRRMRVVLVDNGQQNASQVAAGLINPVTGQRLVKSFEVDRLLPQAMACYRRLADTFKQEFFVPLPMLRLLKNAREQQFAEQRLAQADYRSWLSAAESAAAGIKADFGYLRQTQTGYLKTVALLQAIRQHLQALGCYRQARFDYADLVLAPRLQWQELQPAAVVFCEGHWGRQNPWFGRLPFQPAKGQILTCDSPPPCTGQILNFGHWLIPLAERRFKLGATFEPGVEDIAPTEQAERQLLHSLAQVAPNLASVRVVERQAGIRPATLDKQPFIGPHPRYANLHIFNGFGAKGSLAIPGYANDFAAYLQGRAELPAESRIQRYYETHFTD